MQYYTPPCQCLNCLYPIHANVLRHSVNYTGYALCGTCQENLRLTLRETSRETMKLYFSLKKRGVPVGLYAMQTIDISLVNSSMNIEVGEPDQSYHPGRALAALQQALVSMEGNDVTLRVPSGLIAYNLEETADYITGFLNANNRKLAFVN